MDMFNSNASHWPRRQEAGIVQRVRLSFSRAWSQDTVPHVLVACSGGRDSVVLTHVLQTLERTGALQLSIVHVDHRVRDDSAKATTMVEAFGESLGVPVHTVVLAQDAIDRHQGVGIEEALRRERYLAISAVAREIGAEVIAIGHHQQDQAETVLLHLIRGAGLKGVSGMREHSVIAIPWWNDEAETLSLLVWRPLLTISLEDISDWHRGHHLPLAEDVTNEDRQFRRNAVRHDVLPVLESIFPGATVNLSRFAGLAADDNQHLEHETAQILRETTDGLHRSALLEEDIAIQRRLINQWIRSSDYDGDLTADRIAAVRSLALRNRSGSRVEIGRGWSVQIQAGSMSLRRE